MDGSGCPFWYWEEDYVKVLEQKRILGHGGRMHAQVEAGGSAMGRIGLQTEGSEGGKDVVNWMKILCIVSVCMLLVQVLNLFVTLMK